MLLRVATLACMTLLGGCQLGYYSQAAKGHLSLMGQREPLKAVLADPQTPPQIADSLQFSQQVVRFAGDQLALPAEDVYHQYVALEQDAVVGSDSDSGGHEDEDRELTLWYHLPAFLRHPETGDEVVFNQFVVAG